MSRRELNVFVLDCYFCVNSKVTDKKTLNSKPEAPVRCDLRISSQVPTLLFNRSREPNNQRENCFCVIREVVLKSLFHDDANRSPYRNSKIWRFEHFHLVRADRGIMSCVWFTYKKMELQYWSEHGYGEKQGSPCLVKSVRLCCGDQECRFKKDSCVL